MDKLADAGELFQPVVISAHLVELKEGNFGKTADKKPTFKSCEKKCKEELTH